jgi:hypothetical protein
LGGAVIFAVAVLGARIERFLWDVLDSNMHGVTIDSGTESAHYGMGWSSKNLACKALRYLCAII